MILRGALLATLLALASTPVLAFDPGTASGHYARDSVRLDFVHAVALRQDNAEGLLDHGPQVRVLLSAEDVPVQALHGVVFPPVRAMARQGAVHGLLLEFDPADRTTLRVTVLAKPDDPAAFAPSLSLANSEGLWKRLDASAIRIAGEYRPNDDKGELIFVFDAPVSTDPVQSDLKGADAQKSEQVRVLVARAEAIGRGDLPAAYAVSSRQSAASLRAAPPEMLKAAAGSMGPLIKELKAVKRVVVRRETAVALMSDGTFSSLVLEDGVWKVAD